MLSQTLTGALQPKTTASAPDATSDDITLIHALKNPPLEPLTPDSIFVRRCRLAGDVLDAKNGRFRSEDLSRLLKLVQGAPALIGHNRNSLAVARFFGGAIEQHDGHSYIVPKLYWLRAHSRAEDLRLEIDGGLVNEASIAFYFRKPTCSICNGDIRECSHDPASTYDGQQCFYYYDGIEMVTEGSLVYRGAEPGTALLPNALSHAEPFLIPLKQVDGELLPKVKYKGKLWRLIPV